MKSLEWREQNIYTEKRWVASNSMTRGWLDDYEINVMENGKYRIFGLMKNLHCRGEEFFKSLGKAKARAEDDYQRRQRAEAWREYMETHEIP